MKKTLLTCMAVLALFAIAGSASAITCTIDQRPAATLLVPRFAVSLNQDATVLRDTPASFDTLITIGNASSAPMIAHVSVFNQRSTLVLDFNVALTGFDIQSWRMSDVISGLLPSTPINVFHEGPDTSVDPSPEDACQRNPLSAVYPSAGGYLRVKPATAALSATTDDPILATTAYPIPALPPNGTFVKQIIDSLDLTDDALGCDDSTVDGITAGAAVGYVTVDHANYCNLSNPSDENYYIFNAMGNENNLYGDIIFISGEGVGTYGASAIAIESDPSFAGSAQSVLRTRTFYARYWDPLSVDFAPCSNCGNGNPEQDLLISSPWNVGIGDQREPLGLKWAARYFTNAAVISNITVWRASAGALADLTGSPGTACTDVEPTVQLNFFDEDENGVSQIGPGPCPSPCSTPPPPTFNFPLETNVAVVTDFTLPPPENGVNAGWVSMDFNNPTEGTVLDQAYVSYQFNGGAAFISAHVPGVQLDPSACEPLGLIGLVNPVIPAIPGGVDGSGVPIPPPAGVGP
jgi:hypothetical protein